MRRTYRWPKFRKADAVQFAAESSMFRLVGTNPVEFEFRVFECRLALGAREISVAV